MRYLIMMLSLVSWGVTYACTALGVVTDTGTILSKNRDYFYSHQSFQPLVPVKQFEEWYGNSYGHRYALYGLVSRNDVKFGVNEVGLVAIEEDPPFPAGASTQRRYKQPYQGYSEGMILYGILQNFSTVDEIIPFVDKIFSTAAPNFYQIADKKSILLVEVAYGDSDLDPSRRYSYKLLNKSGEYFAHTNTYLSQEFVGFNRLASSKDALNASNHRLEKITQYLVSAKQDVSQSFDWYLDTASSIGGGGDPQYCLNTSIFRSYIKDLKVIDQNTSSETVYGTLSSFMVKHVDDGAIVYVRILDSIHALPNGDQKLVFKDLTIPLSQLFKATTLNYKTFSMIRKAPENGVCR